MSIFPSASSKHKVFWRLANGLDCILSIQFRMKCSRKPTKSAVPSPTIISSIKLAGNHHNHNQISGLKMGSRLSSTLLAGLINSGLSEAAHAQPTTDTRCPPSQKKQWPATAIKLSIPTPFSICTIIYFKMSFQ